MMDMKKKLEETYLPDQDTRKKRVVVGLSGGLNSYVAAYLLKIQKYDLIGVTVAVGWDKLKENGSDFLACHLDRSGLDAIKEFCNQLGIPHMVVKASDEFKDEVVEGWLANRMTGTKTNQCWNCHELRMHLLYRKMVEMEAEVIATGHLAKLFRHELHASVYVHTSNDEINDQSGILSRLPNDLLDKLMLPLSDLQQKEINKLAENFGLLAISRQVKMHECFNLPNMGSGHLATTIPKKYLKPGDLYGGDKAQLGEHLGIQHYKYGEVLILPKQKQSDPHYLTKYSFYDKKIEVAGPDHFVRKDFLLKNCKISQETSWLEPLRGVLKLNETEYVDCWIYPKNLSSALIELESPHKVLEGDIAVVLKKKGKNSKIYLTGVVKYLAEEKSNIEEGKERVKVDYANDF